MMTKFKTNQQKNAIEKQENHLNKAKNQKK